MTQTQSVGIWKDNWLCQVPFLGLTCYKFVQNFDLICLTLNNRQDQSMFRKQELVRAVERRTVLTLSRELSLILIRLLYLCNVILIVAILPLSTVFSTSRIVSNKRYFPRSMGPVMSMVTSSVTSVTSTASSVSLSYILKSNLLNNKLLSTASSLTFC